MPLRRTRPAGASVPGPALIPALASAARSRLRRPTLRRPRGRRQWLSLITTVVVCGALPFLTGHGSRIDPHKAQALVHRAIVTWHLRMPTSIHCPSAVAVKAGHTFPCTVAYADGSGARFTIHMVGGKGHVEVGLRDVHMTGR